jgi:hypothetical protein
MTAAKYMEERSEKERKETITMKRLSLLLEGLKSPVFRLDWGQ